MMESGTSVLNAIFKTNARDRDKPIKTVAITGLREHFGRDDGIEEPYLVTLKQIKLRLS